MFSLAIIGVLKDKLVWLDGISAIVKKYICIIHSVKNIALWSMHWIEQYHLGLGENGLWLWPALGWGPTSNTFQWCGLSISPRHHSLWVLHGFHRNQTQSLSVSRLGDSGKECQPLLHSPTHASYSSWLSRARSLSDKWVALNPFPSWEMKTLPLWS